MRKPVRAVAIIINEKDQVLLIWRRKKDKEYYVFPGGGVEDKETVKEAVLREVDEETTLQIKIERLLYRHRYIGDSDQFFYLCSYVSGQPTLGEANEKEKMSKSTDDLYKPQWVELNQLKDLLIYPLEIRDWLLEDLENNFKNTPRKAEMEIRDLRQSL